MTETKKSIVVKKDTLEPVETKVKVSKKVEEPEVEETIEEHIFKGSRKSETFANKSSEAAAQAALAAVAQTNKELSLKEAEKTYFQEKKKHMLSRCKKDNIVTRVVPKLYAVYIGKTYTFLYNCIPVTLYCDDKPHEYPEFIAKIIDKKLAKIAASNTYKELIDDRTSQDTF